MKNKKTRNIVIVVLSLVLIFAAIIVVQAVKDTNDMAEEQPAVTQPADQEMLGEKEMESTFQGDAFNFTLMDTEGNTHSLEQYAGKKVYIKFWATWCPSCLEGLAELGELYEQNIDNEDIVILTVVAPGYSGEKSKEKFIEWYNSQELKFTVLFDEGGNTFFEYGIRAVPTSYFIDTKGDIYETKLGHQYNEKIYEIIGSMQ